MTLRYGVIGAGVIAPRHLQAIGELEDVELIGVSSLDAEHMDNEDLLALQPDVVVICTPHPSHPALAIEALEAGAHVLCEKPLAVEVREADAMIEAANRTGRLLGVCFQQRFRPVIEAAHALIEEGRLGPLVRASIVDPLYRPNSYYREAGWRGTWVGEGGGVLLNQAPHTLDLLCHLTGRPVTVWGHAQRRAQPIETEDTATALLEYENGAVGTIAVSTTEPGVQRIELVGDRGRIEIVGESIAFERFEPPLSEHLATCDEMFGLPEIVLEAVALSDGIGDHDDVHRDFADDVHRDFAAAVREGRQPRVPARDALCSLELANAITLSTHVGGSVSLPVDRAVYAKLLAELRAGYRLPSM